MAIYPFLLARLGLDAEGAAALHGVSVERARLWAEGVIEAPAVAIEALRRREREVQARAARIVEAYRRVERKAKRAPAALEVEAPEGDMLAVAAAALLLPGVALTLAGTSAGTAQAA